MVHYKINSPNVIHEIIDGEAVLVNLENGSYYSIDNVGAIIWAYVEKGWGLDQIIETIGQQYAGDYNEIARGIRQLFDQLQTEKLIVPSQSPTANRQTPLHRGSSDPKPQFEIPVLNKYTDMEDLLLLDPIHDVDESGWPHTNPNNVPS